ncbi:hypothetical protein ACWGQ2_12950 [Arthrobacter sp. NPDC055585]
MRAANQNNRTARQLRVRMEAREAFERELRRRRLRDNAFAGAAGMLVLALTVALQVFWFSSNPTADDLEQLRDQARIEQSAPAPSPEQASPSPGP